MCGFGIHMEKRPHRFDYLYQSNRKAWEYWMKNCCTDMHGQPFGWGRILDYIGVSWDYTDEGKMLNIDGQLSLF